MVLLQMGIFSALAEKSNWWMVRTLQSGEAAAAPSQADSITGTGNGLAVMGGEECQA